ncbi:MAG: tripartite tricarboxylate transporter TctB family protein [Chromatiaceae bacterium]|nr:tripartite tricarboxylate transporter TctB family protein [Chromatiaceae bacterium]
MRIVFGRRLAVALLVVLVAGLLFKVSYFQENLEAYLFPAVVAATVLCLSLLSLAREAFDLCIDDFQPFPIGRQWPVIVIMIGGVLLIDTLGMYSTTFLVLLLVGYWYSPEEALRRRLVQSVSMAAGFSLAMYVLFSILLNVQVPRGFLI